MAKYVLLAYRDEKRLGIMSARARAVFEEACRANEQDLRDNGHLYAVEILQNQNVTVQLVDGNVILTDSPSVARMGRSVWLFFIHARDLNAAIQIASQMPQAHIGHVEVRPILQLEFGTNR